MIIFIIKDKFMAFRTKLDYSDNRQILQRERTSTTLSGTTVFGVPFSGLTSGPSTTNSGATETYTLALSTFSGNSATTVFTWYDSRMSLAEPEISALTPSNSGITQDVTVFTPSSTTVIDGNTVNLAYTGVSFDLTVLNMNVSGPSYTGTVEHQQVAILSADTLDYTGRTIWIDNTEITRTKKLIVTESPQVGYVLKCVDSEGKAEWGPVSGATSFTGNTSASCITDLYITNLYGCSPVTVHDNLQHNGSKASGIFTTAFGIGTSATTNYSHAQGILTTSSGIGSHAEGLETTASGASSHAEGQYTTAGGPGSHAEGINTIASGDYSHAEGSVTVASGTGSHAEGQDTTASGNNSHAEGNNTTASGDYSHSQGFETIASGLASHAGGFSNILNGSIVASGTCSFAHFYIDSSGASRGAYGDYSAILGGVDNNIASGSDYSAILGGANNRIAATYSAVIASSGITASRNNTVYVPDLIIDGLTSVTDLQTNADGLIIDGASDVTLKNNVTTISNALDKILNLNPVSFEWKEELKLREGKVYGLIAQEVQNVIPEIVRERAKGNGTLTIEYKELIPWVISAIQELSSPDSPLFKRSELILETQTIASEDNNIELNYNGNKESSLDGGIIVIKGISETEDAKFTINSDGDWITNNNIIPKGIVIPEYTPTSTSGMITRDDSYIYIKGNNGWGRSVLETF
jgi:hypothetical protein